MKTMLWAVIVAGLLVGPALAQTHVYKCVDGAHPVYQQTPCQGRAEWRWDVPADASQSRGVEAAAPARQAKPPSAGTPRRARSSGALGALITLARDPAGCQQGRREQARVMARTRRLDYQQRRQLDDALRLACQPP
ncbi:hypothetical protein [Stenotrophomonas sp. NPDC077659]|uniref:hypothetical protein n=1 Tax=Stenotrophomonas sp. NPDC077659 TaxID=3390694 RepID=UPI003CFFE146